MSVQFIETAYMRGFVEIKRKSDNFFTENSQQKMLIIYKLYKK